MGILAGLMTFDFVVSLTVYKKVLDITYKHSDVLQKESFEYGSDASLIVTKYFFLNQEEVGMTDL